MNIISKDSSPVILPRWMLYVVYSIYAVFGFTVIGSAMQANALTGVFTTNGLMSYGMALVVASIACLVGALFFPKYPIIECLAAGLLFALLSTYLVVVMSPILQGDIDAARRACIAILASLIPIFQSVVLGNDLIRKWTSK